MTIVDVIMYIQPFCCSYYCFHGCLIHFFKLACLSITQSEEYKRMTKRITHKNLLWSSSPCWKLDGNVCKNHRNSDCAWKKKTYCTKKRSLSVNSHKSSSGSDMSENRKKTKKSSYRKKARSKSRSKSKSKSKENPKPRQTNGRTSTQLVVTENPRTKSSSHESKKTNKFLLDDLPTNSTLHNVQDCADTWRAKLKKYTLQELKYMIKDVEKSKNLANLARLCCVDAKHTPNFKELVFSIMSHKKDYTHVTKRVIRKMLVHFHPDRMDIQDSEKGLHLAMLFTKLLSKFS